MVGLVRVVGGLALVPLPGPGWLIVIRGIAIWASEFEPASRLLEFVKDRVRAWEQWLKPQSWWVKGLVALGMGGHQADHRMVVPVQRAVRDGAGGRDHQRAEQQRRAPRPEPVPEGVDHRGQRAGRLRGIR